MSLGKDLLGELVIEGSGGRKERVLGGGKS